MDWINTVVIWRYAAAMQYYMIVWPNQFSFSTVAATAAATADGVVCMSFVWYSSFSFQFRLPCRRLPNRQQPAHELVARRTHRCMSRLCVSDVLMIYLCIVVVTATSRSNERRSHFHGMREKKNKKTKKKSRHLHSLVWLNDKCDNSSATQAAATYPHCTCTFKIALLLISSIHLYLSQCILSFCIKRSRITNVTTDDAWMASFFYSLAQFHSLQFIHNSMETKHTIVYGWRLLLWQFRKLSPTKLCGFVTMPINNRLIQFWLKANVELLVATCCLYQDDDAIVKLNMMHRQTDIWTRWRRACCTGQTHIIHSAPSNTDVHILLTAAAAVVVVTSFGSTNWSAHCDCNISIVHCVQQ